MQAHFEFLKLECHLHSFLISFSNLLKSLVPLLPLNLTFSLALLLSSALVQQKLRIIL